MTSPNSSGPGMHLRDTRLHLALEHAPDAQDLPTDTTRKAINSIAIKSIQICRNSQKVTKYSWWQRLWNQLVTPRSPWNAALATVLLGGIITLLWHGQDAPDAAPDQPTISASPHVEPAKTSPAVAYGVASERAAPVQPPPAIGLSNAKTQIAEPAVATRKALPSTAADTTAPMEQAIAPAPAAKAMAAAPAPTPAAPAAALRAAANDVAAPDWTSATVQINGKTAQLSGEQIRSLVGPLTTLIRRSSQAADAVPSEPATLRLTVSNALGEQSTLDLWPQVLRWHAGGQGPQIRWADAISSQALLVLAERLLPP